MKHIGSNLEKYQNIFLEGFDEITTAGFTQVPNYILRSNELTVGAKIVYSVLLSYAWHKDSCYPGQEKLAQHIGVSDRSVRTYLKELESKKMLSIVQKGLGKTNEYTLYALVQKKH